MILHNWDNCSKLWYRYQLKEYVRIFLFLQKHHYHQNQYLPLDRECFRIHLPHQNLLSWISIITIYLLSFFGWVLEAMFWNLEFISIESSRTHTVLLVRSSEELYFYFGLFFPWNDCSHKYLKQVPK